LAEKTAIQEGRQQAVEADNFSGRGCILLGIFGFDDEFIHSIWGLAFENGSHLAWTTD
jgi:hypothetical protein